jgi:hypothetical protein
MEANSSTELAAILLTMSRTWTALAGQIAQYEAIALRLLQGIAVGGEYGGGRATRSHPGSCDDRSHAKKKT